MATLSVDVILLDWGGTLARVATQEQAWLRGAQKACALLASRGFRHEDAVGRLVEAIHSAEAAAQRDPRHVEVDVRDVFTAWTQACGWASPGDAVRDEAVRVFGESWVGCLEPYPGVAQVLAALRERGYRLGLASNCWTPAPFVHAELDRHGFRPWLDGVTLSCELGYRKPAPVFFSTALSRAVRNGHVPPPHRVLFAGDSPIPDIAGPAAMGMKTALVRNPESACPRGDFERISPDLYVDSIEGLLAHLPGRS
jgi:FMN phosphatase YigB (HAD superfamily)